MQFIKIIFLNYLKIAARVQIKKISPRHIIGITGSAGKSSTREAIFSVIKNEFNVLHCSHGNSESGVPLDLLQISIKDYSLIDWLRVFLSVPIVLLTNWHRYEVILLELGIDSPKSPRNMDYLMSIVQPTMGVFTNVSGVHGENYDYLIPSHVSGEDRVREVMNQIAIAKGKLIEPLPDQGVSILNCDDPRVLSFSQISIKKYFVGKSKISDIRIVDHQISSDKGTIISYKIGEQSFSFRLSNYVLSPNYAYTIGFAIAIGLSLKIDFDKITQYLESNFLLPPSRMSLLQGSKGRLIIDSSYNASENSMIDALNLLNNINHAGKKVAILGDLRELGLSTQLIHKTIWDLAKKTSDIVYTVGPNFKNINPEGWLTAKEAWDKIDSILPSNSIVLIKGSQNTIFLETIVEKLLLNAKDCNLLCRQSNYWILRKQKFFSDC